MKKTILLFIAIISLGFTFQSRSVKNDTNNFVILSGEIENPNSDSLQIFDKNYDFVQTIFLTEDNTFRDTLILAEGFYRINDGKESTQIYLKPSFDLRITLNTDEFDETIKYEGKGANENNYLAEKALLEESFGQLNYYGYYAKLPVNEFMALTDSLHSVQRKLLEEKSDLDKDFLYIESNTLDFGRLQKYADYESMKRYFTNNPEFNVSNEYPKPYKNMDLSNEKLLNSTDYLGYVKSYLNKLNKEKFEVNDSNTDYTLAFVNTIIEELNSDSIRQEILYSIGKYNLGDAKNLDQVYNTMKPFLTHNAYLKVVNEKYNTLKRIEKGAISPSFEFEDINGKTVSLNDLKGKLVYIDIWATWCMPCIKEIPSLKKMVQHFEGENIEFVSICMSDTEERWRKMVEEKQLGGIQLFSHDVNDTFFKDYSVEGIPRFILLDENGRIIDANAKRPSDATLIQEIESNL